MKKPKYYPLRKGFNDCLGYYQKNDDAHRTKKKEVEVSIQPEPINASIEIIIPTIEQYSINFDVD